MADKAKDTDADKATLADRVKATDADKATLADKVKADNAADGNRYNQAATDNLEAVPTVADVLEGGVTEGKEYRCN